MLQKAMPIRVELACALMQSNTLKVENVYMWLVHFTITPEKSL